jgi:hypothetical protein
MEAGRRSREAGRRSMGGGERESRDLNHTDKGRDPACIHDALPILLAPW